MKKISVIIPCYNGEKTIERCLCSILSQTYTNLEIIVVDDGSTDKSLRHLHSFTAKDSRITVVSKANGGVSSARNAGLRLADGDYIQFVDIDDHLHPTMLQRLAETLETTDADIAVCRFSHCCFKPFLSGGLYDMQNEDDFKQFYLDFFTYNVPWNKLYRRQIISAKFDESVKIFEDGLFVLSTLLKSGRVAVLEDELYNYYNADTGSAVNKFLKSKFWRTKQGYWYKFDAIKPLFDAVLTEGGHTDKVLEYARSFDMAFWELIKLIDSGCGKKICSLEMHGILNQPNFVASVQSRGFAYAGTDRKAATKFVAKCCKMICDYKQAQKTQKKALKLAKKSDADNINVGVLYSDVVQSFYDECLSHCSARSASKADGTGEERDVEFLPRLMPAKSLTAHN